MDTEDTFMDSDTEHSADAGRPVTGQPQPTSTSRLRKVIAWSVGAMLIGMAGGAGIVVLVNQRNVAEQAKAQAAASALADARAKARQSSIAGVRTWKNLGRKHVTGPVVYPMSPPVGGNHSAVWIECTGKVYDAPVRNERAVHSLEHGAVWVTYNAKASAADLGFLSRKVTRTPYSFMSPYPTEKSTITLSAWGVQLDVTSARDPRVKQFLLKYVQGSQTPEPGGPCGAPPQGV
jgi:hypothetical protein